MMKNILIRSVLLLTVFLTISCEDDDYEAPYGDYSSFSWYTSEGFDTSEKVLNVNNYVAFVDLSQNALEHSWTIPASAKFLDKKFTEKDSVYDAFIIPLSGMVSSEKLINVLFTEPGLQEVKLRNVFKDSVTDAIKTDGQWIVEKTFTVNVFANVNPAGKIYKNGVEVFAFTEDQNPSIDDMDSWPTIDIEAGDALDFEDLTTIGNPTGRKWYFTGGKPETSSVQLATILFNKLGVATVRIEGIRTGDGVPKNTVSKLIPLKINVIPSTKPFVFNGGLKIDTEGIISFNVTGEVESLLKQEGKFTVSVVNTAAGFNKNIAVSSVKVNSTDATIIELTLAEPVYNTDQIKVSFTNGEIISVDSRVLANFGPETVKIPLGSSVLVESWAGFENPSSSGNTVRKANADGYWVGALNDANSTYWLTDEKKFAGNYSMRYSSASGVASVTLQGSDFSKPSGIEAGTYKVSYMIYLETGNTMKAFTNALQAPFQTLTWDISSTARGEWVEISQIVTTDAISSGARFDLKIDAADNPGVTGKQVLYIDNLSWVKLVPRS